MFGFGSDDEEVGPPSRRRQIAFDFLSNISLDGTYPDTRINMGDEPQPSTSQEDTQEDPDQIVPDTLQRLASVAESDLEICERMDTLPSTSALSTPFRERAGTGGSEQRFRSLSFRKRALHAEVLSSNDSLMLTDSKRGVRQQPIPEVAPVPREVRVVKSGDSIRTKDDRVIVFSSGNAPVAVFSLLSYNKGGRLGNRDVRREGRRRNTSGPRPMSVAEADPWRSLGLDHGLDDQEVSYGQLLMPSKHFARERWLLYTESDAGDSPGPRHHHPVASSLTAGPIQDKWCFSLDAGTHRASHSPPQHYDSKYGDLDEGHGPGSLGSMHCCPPFPLSQYHPNLLDDPELISGKHRTLLTFPSYMTSVIDYVRPSDLKKELNDKFRDRYPSIELTLSKLRSIKREMKKIGKNDCCVDLFTVAQSYVFFEKLILKCVVKKENRKLCAGACLILACKLNDYKGDYLKQIIEKIETNFRINRKTLVSFEFAVLVALEFGLILPMWQVNPHYHRLMAES